MSETSVASELPAELLTPHTLAQTGAALDSLHASLRAAGVSVDAYSGQLRTTWDYVDAHPEDADTVRLMGGDAHDLVTALMAQWLAQATADRQPPQAVTDGRDASSDTDSATAAAPIAPISFACRRRTRKRAGRSAES